MSIDLTKTETRILTDAAGREGSLLVLPAGMKEVTAQRVLGKLLKNALVVVHEEDGATEHHLTTAGYRAIGLKPPRRARSGAGSEGAPAALRETKQSKIVALLGRDEGASVAELMATTGWLPHTTRAALSRLRSGGQTLAKSKREDGTTAYRILPIEPKPVSKRRPRQMGEQAEAVAG